MKKKIIFILCLLCHASMFAEFSTNSSITTGLGLSFSPISKPISGNDHFALPTSFGGGVIGFVTGSYGADFPILLGEHPIFTGSAIRTQANFTLTPVTTSPAFSVKFAPFPFLSFSAGGTIGTGWTFADELLVAISTYDKVKKKYTTSSAFSTMYYDASIGTAFQFDMAVFLPGEWTHIITTASYGVRYVGITSGGENGNPWKYLMYGSDKVNGLTYSASAMLGYAMPLALKIVGIQANFSGYFFEDDFTTESYDWNPTFMNISLSVIGMLEITENQAIAFQSGVSRRRSFDKNYADDIPLFDKKAIGREWYFNGISILYTYKFKIGK